MDKVTINSIDVYSEYGLILAEKSIGIPEKQLITIEVPGRDGALDLTDQFYATSKYRNRTISLRFINRKGLHNNYKWSELLSEVQRQFHGKMTTLTFSDDPLYCYTGRCSIDSFTDVNSKRTIQMEFDCEPYKRLISNSNTKVL